MAPKNKPPATPSQPPPPPVPKELVRLAKEQRELIDRMDPELRKHMSEGVQAYRRFQKQLEPSEQHQDRETPERGERQAERGPRRGKGGRRKLEFEHFDRAYAALVDARAKAREKNKTKTKVDEQQFVIKFFRDCGTKVNDNQAASIGRRIKAWDKAGGNPDKTRSR